MAIMPHPERAPSAPMPKIFTSMRKYMQARAEGKNPLVGTAPALEFTDNKPALEPHTHRQNSIEFFVELIITDNEAETIQNALRQRGFDVNLRKWNTYEIATQAGEDQNALATQLVNSGEFCNLNKERVTTVTDQSAFPKKAGSFYYLVWDKEDSAGLSLGSKLGRSTRRAWLWEVTPRPGFTLDPNALLATNIFANHHAQELRQA